MSRSLRRGGQLGHVPDGWHAGLVLVNVVVVVLIGAATLTQADGPREIGGTTLDPGGAQRVVVVTGEGSADGLIAQSLGDIVFTVPLTAPLGTSVLERLQRLQPTQVVILGGPDIVSEGVVAALTASTTASVMRYAGRDRFATAAEAATATFEAPVLQLLIASSADSQPAMALKRSDAGDLPVLLVTRDAIPADTVDALQRLRPQSVAIVGDAAVVSDAVRRQLQTHTTGEVKRLPDV